MDPATWPLWIWIGPIALMGGLGWWIDTVRARYLRPRAHWWRQMTDTSWLTKQSPTLLVMDRQREVRDRKRRLDQVAAGWKQGR